jgi:hypothetical protein
MGGSASGNSSKSESQGGYSEGVWGGQSPFLQNLYGQANRLGQNQDFSRTNQQAESLGGYNDQIMSNAQGGQQQQLGGGSFGNTTDIRQKLMNNMGQPSQTGQMYNSIVGGAGNEYIEPMIQGMQGDMNKQMESGFNSTAQSAANMGQSAGGSQAYKQNLARDKELMGDFQQQSNNVRSAGYDKDMQMKMMIANQADQGNQANSNRMMQMMQGADQNVQNGMNQGQGMQNLGMGSMAPWMQANQQPWNMMQNQASVIGGPQVLGSGSQSGSSKGAGVGASGSYK